MPTYKAIIFDLGKVVFDLSFDRVFESWAVALGLAFSDVKNKFVFDALFDDFERGEVDNQFFRATVSKRLGLKINNADFDEGWCSLYLEKYAGIDDLLERLKNDFRLVALTNTNAIHHKVWTIKYADLLCYFEKVFRSHEMGARKPEPKSYKIVLDYLRFEPAETIFLDDNPENIKAAAILGIAPILVTSFGQMKNDLLRLLSV